ncbi:hypothetical protein [Fluviibacterium sp. S390]
MSVEREPDNPAAPTAEQFFPEWREDIRRLRANRPIFDEICRDLELVAGMLRDKDPDDPAATECLEGLKDEIRRALMRDPGGA